MLGMEINQLLLDALSAFAMIGGIVLGILVFCVLAAQMLDIVFDW
jgi:hypothetical protein